MILLPIPKKVEEKEGSLMLRMNTMIMMDQSCPQGARVYAGQLKEEISTWAGLKLDISRGVFRKGDILLKVDESLDQDHYSLKIDREGSFLTGGSLHALGYAVQTLRQIVRQKAGLLPWVSIEDEPDIKNRGFYHDATRGRIQSMENLKKLADTLCFYKMNQLQLYVEHTYLFRDMTELWRDEEPLTAEEIMELDQYCYDRGIELIPSLATFGHMYKLLGTRTCEDLCEMPDSFGKMFSFEDRMAHHTVNVSNPGSIAMVKNLVREFMQLFRTDKFNICADETFDLGKGKSAKLAEEKGTGVLYVDYIKELFQFLVDNGKVPMFWGDIISGHPELCPELPKEVICLTWGYVENQSDWAAKIIHKAGALQYLCPGVCGWNTWVNYMSGSYKNIVRMCGFARQYNAIGVLNTDWGDFGHVNQPIFSIPGLIYGAVCSWGENVPEYEEMNRQISILEFGDASGEFVGLLGEGCGKQVFGWYNAVAIKEWAQKGREREKIQELFEKEDMSKVPDRNGAIEILEAKLRECSRHLDSRSRWILECAHVALEATRVWNETGLFLSNLQKGQKPENGAAIAGELERCLHYYQRLWRENSKSGDIDKISDVFCWYADLLRRPVD